MRIFRTFTIVARFEAFTWAGLLFGMYLKHVLEVTDVGVWVFGRLHGVAFLAYCVVAIVASARLQWPWWATLLAVLAAIPPLVTLPLELWFNKIGLLAPKTESTAQT
jgi:integral membrane protein